MRKRFKNLSADKQLEKLQGLKGKKVKLIFWGDCDHPILRKEVLSAIGVVGDSNSWEDDETGSTKGLLSLWVTPNEDWMISLDEIISIKVL